MTHGDRHNTPLNRIGAILGCDHPCVTADHLDSVHRAVDCRFRSLRPPVCHCAVSHGVILARRRSQLTADRACFHLDQAVIGRIAVQDIPFLQALVDLAHISLPQRRGRAGTCGLGGKSFIVIMSDPYGGSVIPGDTGEENALLVGVGTRLAAHDLSTDLRACTCTALDHALQHVHDHPGSTGLENRAAFLVLVSVPDHMARGVGNAQHGDRFLVNAAVGQHAKGNGHLQRCDTGGTKTEAKGCRVDMTVVNTQPVQEIDTAVHADHVHQRVCRGCIMGFRHGGPQRFRTGIASTAVVLREGIVALGVFPSLNGKRHVVNHSGRAGAQFQRGSVYRDRFDGRANRHLHVRGTVQGLLDRHFIPGTDDRLQLACPVIKHNSGRLGLNGFCIGTVGIFGPEHLVGRIPQGRIFTPVLQRGFHRFLDIRINSQLYPVSAGPEFVFHRGTVLGIILQSVQLQQDTHNFLYGVFHIMGILIHAVAGRRSFLKHMGRSRVQGFLILFPGNELVLIHAPEHIICPVVGHLRVVFIIALPGIQVPPRIIIIGIVGGAGQNSAFPQGQVTQVLAEIALCRHLYTIVVFTQENGVQVALQDLVLGIPVLQLQGQVGFLDLSLIALFRRKQGVFDQLLGNGGSALGSGGSQVGNKRADNTLQVHTAVGIEAGILHSDKRVAEHLRHGVQGHQHAVFRSFVFRDQVAVGIIDKGGLRLGVHCHQVQLGSRVHIALGDSRQRAETGHTGQHQDHKQHTDRIQQNADNKVRFPGFGPEYRAGLRLVFRFLVVISAPGSFFLVRFSLIISFLIFIISGFLRIVRFVRGIIFRFRVFIFRKKRLIAFFRRKLFVFLKVFFVFLLSEHLSPPVHYCAKRSKPRQYIIP